MHDSRCTVMLWIRCSCNEHGKPTVGSDAGSAPTAALADSAGAVLQQQPQSGRSGAQLPNHRLPHGQSPACALPGSSAADIGSCSAAVLGKVLQPGLSYLQRRLRRRAAWPLRAFCVLIPASHRASDSYVYRLSSTFWASALCPKLAIDMPHTRSFVAEGVAMFETALSACYASISYSTTLAT